MLPIFTTRTKAGVPLTTIDGHNLGTLCVIDKEARAIDQDQIEDLKDLAAMVMDQIEIRLAARRAATQAGLMAKEIDHRVMNSLQFVSGLLTMQARTLSAGEAAGHLHLAANRVAAVAQFHRHFYAGESDTTSCIMFLRRLCADLQDIVGRTVKVRGEESDVPTTWIQPIGLIVNELVTNAAKHGQGEIDVLYEFDSDRHALIVSDEGRDLSDKFDPDANRKSLGMKVVTSLAGQLGGKLTSGRRPDGGTCFKVSFPGILAKA